MAEMKFEDRSEDEPRPPSLASALADDSAARLLVFDELPAEEKPRPGDRVLLVGIVWGGSTLVELEQVACGADLTVQRLFDLPTAVLPKNFKLVKHLGTGHVISLPDGMTAEVHGAAHHESLSQKGWRIEAPFRGIACEIGTADRIVVQLAPQLTLIARYVRETRPRRKSLLRSVDIPFASVILVALLLLAFFFRAVSTAIIHPLSYTAELQLDPERYTRYQVKPAAPLPAPVEQQQKPKDLSGVEEGEKAKADEGTLGKEEAKPKQAEPAKPGTKRVDPDKKNHDLRRIRNLGLIAALSKMGASGGGAASAVLGPGGLGTGINNSLGGRTRGAGQGDQYGSGGTGTRGNGSGGGGAAMGIGGLGTKGLGAGHGGYGSADLGGRGKEETIFVPGRTTVEGGLSRDVINRVIQKHYNEIKYCYEKELTKDPALYGKVTVLFVIDGEGKVSDALVQQTTMSSEPVETCMVNHVRRWTFPAPQGGGTVQVTYPYVFKNGNQ